MTKVEFLSLIIAFFSFSFGVLQYFEAKNTEKIQYTIQISEKLPVKFNDYSDFLKDYVKLIRINEVDSESFVSINTSFREKLSLLRTDLKLLIHCVEKTKICRKDYVCVIFEHSFQDFVIKLRSISSVYKKQSLIDTTVINILSLTKKLLNMCQPEFKIK